MRRRTSSACRRRCGRGGATSTGRRRATCRRRVTQSSTASRWSSVRSSRSRTAVSKPVTLGVICTSPPSSPSVSTSAFAPSGPVRADRAVCRRSAAPRQRARRGRARPRARARRRSCCASSNGRAHPTAAHRAAFSSTASDNDRRRSFSAGPVRHVAVPHVVEESGRFGERRRRVGHCSRDVSSLLTGRLAGHVVEKAVARELRDQRAVPTPQRVPPSLRGFVLRRFRPPVVRVASRPVRTRAAGVGASRCTPLPNLRSITTTSATAAMRITLAMKPPPATPLIASSTRLIASDTHRSIRSMIDGPGRWNSTRDSTSFAASRLSACVACRGQVVPEHREHSVRPRPGRIAR